MSDSGKQDDQDSRAHGEDRDERLDSEAGADSGDASGPWSGELEQAMRDLDADQESTAPDEDEPDAHDRLLYDEDVIDLQDFSGLSHGDIPRHDEFAYLQEDALAEIDDVFEGIDAARGETDLLFDWQVDESDDDSEYQAGPLVAPGKTSDAQADDASSQDPAEQIDFDLMDFSATLDRKELPANQAGAEVNCQVTIDPTLNRRWTQANEISAGVCLLVDCSLSMYGDKFRAAVDTARLIAEILHERHLLSVVAFHTRSQVIVKNVVPSEENRDSINAQIDTLEEHLGGSTNLAAGIESAIGILDEADTDSRIVLIISDGEPNSFSMAQKQAEIANRKGIQFHAVGIGDAYNADQLLRLVTPYNGAVYGDNDVKNMDRIFRDLVDRIGKIFATNVRLTFNFDERVELRRAFKTRPERVYYDLAAMNYRDHQLTIHLGNMEGDKRYEYLLQFGLDAFDAGMREVMNLQLQYDINYQGRRSTEKLEFNLEIDFTEDEIDEPTAASHIGDALRSASVLQSSRDLLQAIDGGDNETALEILDDLRQRSEEEENLNLQRQLDEIERQLQSGGRLGDKARNDLLLAASEASAAREPPMVHKPAPLVVEESEPLVEEPEPAVEEPEPEVEEPPAEAPPIEEPPVELPPIEEPEPAIDEPEADIEAPQTVLEDAEVAAEADTSLYQVYDLVLIDVGADPIRFMRETRHATRMGLRQIADLMRTTNTLIHTFDEFSDAEALQQRLTSIGARTELYGRHDGGPG